MLVSVFIVNAKGTIEFFCTHKNIKHIAIEAGEIGIDEFEISIPYEKYNTCINRDSGSSIYTSDTPNFDIPLCKCLEDILRLNESVDLIFTEIK